MASNEKRDSRHKNKPHKPNQGKPNEKDSSDLKDMLQQSLHYCGWRNSIRTIIRNILDQRGVQNVCYRQVAEETIPIARALLPETVRHELQLRMRNTLEMAH